MFFVLGQKARGGCSLWEQEAREVKPSAGPKYGIARSPGLLHGIKNCVNLI